MKHTGTGILIACVFMLAACATEKQQRMAETLENPPPVNCATAREDIATLQEEKARTVERLRAGISSVLPIGLVVGVASGTQGTKTNVATGKYNDMIDERIAVIKEVCKI